MANKKNKNQQEASWRSFLKFYTTFRIPWFWLLATTLFSLVAKEITVLLVPYTSKIMTGAINEGGFLMAFILLNLASSMTEAIQEGLLDMTRIRTHRNVNRSVWGRILRLPMSYFDRQDPQKLVSRLTKDTEGAVGTLNCALQVFTVFFGIYESFRRMYATYKSLSLIMLCGIPVVLITGWSVGQLNYKVTVIQNHAMSAMTNFFAQRLPGIFHIKTSNMEEEEEKRGIEENDRRYRAEIKAEKLFILSMPLSSIGNYVFEIVLLVLASALVRSGEMKMFQLVNMYNYYVLFMSNTLMLLGIWQGIKTSHGSSAVTATIMDEPVEVISEGKNLPEENETISFEHVSFSYDGKHPVLSDVSFQIPKGKKTVIVGENGSGKSTLIQLLEGFRCPTGGTIRFGSLPMEQIKLEDLRNKVGCLSQGNQIIKGTIRENMLYGIDRSCSDEEILQAAKMSNTQSMIEEKPKGLDTLISCFDNKVSGGEMQRIAIARMMLKKPLYLIMDEATSGLDTTCQKEIMEHITSMMNGKTIIMISHNLEEIKAADHIVVLNQGEIEASGSYEEVCRYSTLIQGWDRNIG